jgi:hypothetical protein
VKGRSRLALGGAAALALLACADPARAAEAVARTSADGAPAAATVLEAYLREPGRLVVERTYALPPIALQGGERLLLEAIVVFEPGREQERVLGVRASAAGAAAYLDLHEVEDLARSLAALPTVLEPERAQEAAVEVRFRTRGGFGIAVATGASPAHRAVRFDGPPRSELALSEPALEQLRVQLDACRRYLFGE